MLNNKAKNSFKRILFLIFVFILIITSIVFADSPTRTEVEETAANGIRLFFGALGGIAVVMGGMEFYGAFLSFRESERLGGSGESHSRVKEKVFAGIMCLVAAVLVFVVQNWALNLFNLG